MIALYAKYRIFIFSFLLITNIVITIYLYLNYRKRKYTQPLLIYGYLLLIIGLVIILITIIFGMDQIFSTVAAALGIIGLLLVGIGTNKERCNKNILS